MNIACLLDEGFEDSEFKDPYVQLRAAGHGVTVIGLERGATLSGYRGHETITTDQGITDSDPDEFDALFMPGGYSPDHWRADDRMVDFVRRVMQDSKPVPAICHGSQLVLSAGVAEGRRMTAWKTVQNDLRYAGADVVDEEVVVDGNLVTSRRPSNIPAFVAKGLELLRS